MDQARDRQPACGFCEGSGLWSDLEIDPAAPDPCPLCNGTGMAPGARPPAAATAPAEAPVTVVRMLAVLPDLSQSERQRLYEELHARYACRIYRS